LEPRDHGSDGDVSAQCGDSVVADVVDHTVGNAQLCPRGWDTSEIADVRANKVRLNEGGTIGDDDVLDLRLGVEDLRVKVTM